MSLQVAAAIMFALTVLAGVVEEEVDVARRVSRMSTVVVEADVVRHSDEHVLF